MSYPIIRKPYERHSLKLVGFEPTRTQQADFDQTDVNAIVARFARTGYLPPSTKEAQYMDCTPFQEDITEALNRANNTVEIAENFRSTWQPPSSPPPEPSATPVPPAPPADPESLL